MFEVRFFDTITGSPLLTPGASDGSWNTRLDGTSEGSVSVPLRARGISQATARDLFRPNARLCAFVDEFDTVAAAGMIMRPKYDRASGVVTGRYVDIRDIARQRMGFGVGSWNTSGTLTVSNRSYAAAVRAIVSRMMRDGGEPTWGLPIDLPPDGSGPFSRKWEYYGFFTADDMLREVEAEGAEVFFAPYLNAGNLRFQTEVGAPIVGGAFDLPVTAEGSRVTNLSIELDGSKQLTGVIYGGNGTEADQLTAWAGHGPYTTPIRDAYRSAKDAKTVAQLQRMADADLAEHFTPVEQWSFDVQLDQTVRAAHVLPSRLLNLDVRADDWQPDGVYAQRVVGVSGGLGPRVSLEVQAYG